MATVVYTQIGDVNRDCGFHDYEMPAQEPSTPRDSSDGTSRTDEPEIGESPLSDPEIAFTGVPFQEPKNHEKMHQIVMAPYKYIESLPSKGVRNVLIDALNVWFKVPDASREIIREVTGLLHTSSLMFDDIEDGSHLRRGKPTTHKIFGVAQTINSSTYILMSSIARARLLSNKECVDIVIDGVGFMLEGQGMDLYTTYLTDCPQEHDYLEMVDRKTGGLFLIAYQLMRAEAVETKVPELHTVMSILGRFFQIRDDYLNLVSEEYTGKKGFCEDLDEGKLSFPLIHCLGGMDNGCPDASYQIEMKSILATRSRLGECGLSAEVKVHMLDILRCAGSIEFTKLSLERLEKDLRAEIMMAETISGVRNPILLGLVDKMKI